MNGLTELSSLRAATFEITEDGNFVQPGQDLAALLLGPGESPESLVKRNAEEFQALHGQWEDFLTKLKAAPSSMPVTGVLMILAAGNQMACLCNAIWLPASNSYRGLVAQIQDDGIMATMMEEQRSRAVLHVRGSLADGLAAFERSIAEAAARMVKHVATAFYRRHSSGTYLLRSECNLPNGARLERIIPNIKERLGTTGSRLPSLIDFSEATATVTRPMTEYLLPIAATAGEDPGEIFGYLWIGHEDNYENGATLASLQAFARELGTAADDMETSARQAAGRRFFDLAVGLLLSKDPGKFYMDYLKFLLQEIPAEACSIFELREERGEARLFLVASSGIAGYPCTRWWEVSYRLGEGLTGSVAEEKKSLSSLKQSNERDRRGLGRWRFEEVVDVATTWLGCPILDPQNQLLGFIRMTNRKVGSYGPASGFSEADLKLAESCGQWAGRFLDFEKKSTRTGMLMSRFLHELNAPIGSIRSRVGSMLRSTADKKHLHWLQAIECDAYLLKSLADDIELADETVVPILQDISLWHDVGKPLRAYLTAYAIRHKYRTLYLKVRSMAQIPRLSLDGAMMRQVFTNLITNAIKYGPPPTRPASSITVEIDWNAVEEKGKLMYHIHVRDFGMGIAEEARHEIFNLGMRTKEAIAHRAVGKGIGLYVVRRIIEAHQGWIWLEHTHNPTEFVIALPGGPAHG